MVNTFSFKRMCGGEKMKQVLKKVSVKGYNKTHNFSIERYSVSGHTFYHFIKNNSIILNCTEKEFHKMRDLFNV